MFFSYTLHKQNKHTFDIIDSMYHLSVSVDVYKRAILPDGKLDVVFLFNPMYKLGENGPFLKEGIYTQSNLNAFSEIEIVGNFEILGIRFHPHTFFRVFSIPPIEIPSGIQPLKTFVSINQDNLLTQIRELKEVEQKLRFVENWITSVVNLNKHHFAFEHILMQRITQIDSIKILDELCINHSVYKRLQRYFSKVIGVSPKQYKRLLRLDGLHQKLISLTPEDVCWDDVVFELGFYDQSHLSKELKALIALTPTKFLESAHFII